MRSFTIHLNESSTLQPASAITQLRAVVLVLQVLLCHGQIISNAVHVLAHGLVQLPGCPLTSVGDEYHLVFECPILQPLRDKYHTLFSSFAQKDRMIVYSFISDCLDMINAQY